MSDNVKPDPTLELKSSDRTDFSTFIQTHNYESEDQVMIVQQLVCASRAVGGAVNHAQVLQCVRFCAQPQHFDLQRVELPGDDQ